MTNAKRRATHTRRPTRRALLILAALVITITAAFGIYQATQTPTGTSHGGTISIPNSLNPDPGVLTSSNLNNLSNNLATLIHNLAPNPTTSNNGGGKDGGTGNNGGGGTSTPDTAATSNTTTATITPPGTKWWPFITSTAPLLEAWTAPAPANATFYATTTNATTNTATAAKSGANAQYQILYIGFPTIQAASQWLATAKYNPNTSNYQRGNVITITPNWIKPTQEPFPSSLNTNMHPTAAVWNINYGANIAQQAATSLNPKIRSTYAEFWKHLGFNPTTSWTGAATNPNGPWVGTLTNFTPANIDFYAAAAELGQSETVNCGNNGQGTCDITDRGLLAYADGSIFKTPNSTVTIGTNTKYLPKNAPSNAILTFGIDVPFVQGIVGATFADTHPQNALQQGWITTYGGADILTLMLPNTTAASTDPYATPSN